MYMNMHKQNNGETSQLYLWASCKISFCRGEFKYLNPITSTKSVSICTIKKCAISTGTAKIICNYRSQNHSYHIAKETVRTPVSSLTSRMAPANMSSPWVQALEQFRWLLNILDICKIKEATERQSSPINRKKMWESATRAYWKRPPDSQTWWILPVGIVHLSLKGPYFSCTARICMTRIKILRLRIPKPLGTWFRFLN